MSTEDYLSDQVDKIYFKNRDQDLFSIGSPQQQVRPSPPSHSSEHPLVTFTWQPQSSLVQLYTSPFFTGIITPLNLEIKAVMLPIAME